jgi:hypothetical protein
MPAQFGIVLQASSIESLRAPKPSEVSVELPTQFQPIVNLKTGELRISVPPAFLAGADEVIE